MLDFLFWWMIFGLALVGALYLIGICVQGIRTWLYWRRMGV